MQLASVEHGQAIGMLNALLDAVVTYAWREEFVRLVLSPSERSIPFYHRAGFRPADSLMVMIMA